MQASPNNIDKIIFIIVSIFLLGAFFLLYYIALYNKRKRRHEEEKANLQREYQHQLLQSQIEVQEATYAALGKELHDNVGQLLGTAKLMLGITERKLTAPPDTLLTASQTLSEAIREIRTLAKVLSPEWLQQFSFSENLNTEIHRINSTGIICITLGNHITQLPLPAEQQIILFRIVQEALQNAIKHAAATSIDIQLAQTGHQLRLSIADNGSGIAPATQPAGTGLLNMQCRTQLLGGTINWHPNPGGGTIVLIQLPLNTNA